MDRKTEMVKKFWTDNEKALRALRYASVSITKIYGIEQFNGVKTNLFI